MGGRPPITDEMFVERIDRSGGPDACWPWQGPRHPSGYGSVGGHDRAHRRAYRMWVGPIPEGLFICHHCDNPPCVNPAHLYAGTAADNSRDLVRRGRHRASGIRGSQVGGAKLTEADIPVIWRRIRTGEPLIYIALDYGVCRSTVAAIKRGRNWRHIQEASHA